MYADMYTRRPAPESQPADYDKLGQPNLLDGASEDDFDQYLDILFPSIVSHLDDKHSFLDDYRRWTHLKSQRSLEIPGDAISYQFSDTAGFFLVVATDSKSDGTNIIHFLAQEVERSAVDGQKAAELTSLVLQNCQDLAEDVVQSPWESMIQVNALELASNYPKCLGIVKAICAHPFQSEDHENCIDPDGVNATLLDHRHENASITPWKLLGTRSLSIAIKAGNVTCASYILQRMRQEVEHQELREILDEQDHNGLTPLHLATEFKLCSLEQIELVKHLIKCYPDALGKATGSLKIVNGSKQQHMKVKGSLEPYKYFLESRDRCESATEISGINNPGKHRPAHNGGRRKRIVKTPGAASSQNVSLNPVIAKHTGENAADMMLDLLKLSCMRYFGRNRTKLIELLNVKHQIHLDFDPRKKVTSQLLGHIARMDFEQYLQYVSIPNLCVRDVENEELKEKPWWHSTSRKDYAYIFAWLRKDLKVKKIIRVKVEDDEEHFHSDEIIEDSLRLFDVEEWNWVKWDLCSDTIGRAAPNVREVDLYWSGNSAILNSWAAENGLVQLSKLEKIRIRRRKSIESQERTKTIVSSFISSLKSLWKLAYEGDHPPPDIEFLLHSSSATINQNLKRSLKEMEEKGRQSRDRWLRCTDEFAKVMKRWLNDQLSDSNSGSELKEQKVIKVAVIDDGVDMEEDGIGESIAAGETFYDYEGNWPGFYQSSHGHGHMMACLIRDMCPKVKLYVAKLNEKMVDGKPQITSESAANAIKWSTSKGVDIISMSWTIENVSERSKSQLEEAVKGATDKGVLLFCACDDQGNLTQHPYPANISANNFFKIGTADTLGNRHKTINSTFFDYIAPGSEDSRYGVDEPESLEAVKSLFGSSIATARCAGLAAIILQCIVLMHDPKTLERSEIRNHRNMELMFRRMVDDADENKYIKVWNVFEVAMRQPGKSDDYDGDMIANVAERFLSALDYRPHKSADFPCIS